MTSHGTRLHDLPLRGRRILVTLDGDAGVELRTRLAVLGGDVSYLPAILIRSPSNMSAFDAALRDLPAYDWVAFTSRNAVKAFFSRLVAVDPRASMPNAMKVAAIGPSTHAELESRGVCVTCVPSEATASSLADAMVQVGIDGASVLLPQGDLARPNLRDGLERAGAHVHAVVAYETVRPVSPSPDTLQAIASGNFNAIVLASPSAVINLTEMLDVDRSILRHTPLVCIGPTTAAAVQAIGLEPAAVATEHTVAGLVGAITSYFHSEK